MSTPRETFELVGQDAAERSFLAAWNSGRVPHAWLIGGPSGVGKATLAFRIARFVLTQSVAAKAAATSLTTPPDHPVARQIIAGSHPDLLVLEPGQINPETGKPTREIVVPQVRNAVQFCRKTPTAGPWRAVIIDPAEAMNRNAANALLKVLEEPPARCLILLTSNVPRRLLATIRSRCRLMTLQTLSDAQIATIVRGARSNLSEEALETVVALAEGSVGRALALAEGDAAAVHGAIQDILRELPRLSLPAVHAFADRVARPGEDEGSPGIDGFALVLDLLLRHAAGAARTAGLAPQGRGAVESWVAVWEKIGRLQARADTANLDRKMVLLDAFLAIEAATQRATAAAA
jgi:DNA polymerase-3 subunit delta'